MKIAVFHYFISDNNPAGKCVKAMIDGLSEKNSIVVFSNIYESEFAHRVEWVKVPVIRRPLVLLYVTFFIMATLLYAIKRIHKKFDKVIFTESRLPIKGISYAHYCHGAYLKNQWQLNTSKGFRRLLKFLNHKIHAVGEYFFYPRLKTIVVPSRGLNRELKKEYSLNNISIIPNPVKNNYMKAPQTFDCDAFRKAQGFNANDIVLVFVALGDFERKGLPIVFSALSMSKDTRLRLLVVGGNGGLIREYKKSADALEISSQVKFVGMQKDVRPFLWASDCFVFPTMYEIFPLVVLEAAAAGLLLLVTNVYGVEEYIEDAVNCIIIERNAESLKSAFDRLLAMSDEDRKTIGRQAQHDVANYSTDAFVMSWKRLLNSE